MRVLGLEDLATGLAQLFYEFFLVCFSFPIVVTIDLCAQFIQIA
jgi:hypothetical protein